MPPEETTDRRRRGPHRLSLERIANSRSAIDSAFLDTPQFEHAAVNAQLGCRLLLKNETQNPIHSFKARGAYLFVSQLRDRPHLVCSTAGNFGQGLAHAARAQGLALTIFTAADISPVKLDRMRILGAEVRVSSGSSDVAHAEAVEFATTHGARLVVDGQEAAIAEGAGTIGAELLRDPENFGAIIVPVGDGALIAGIARWVRAYAPEAKIYGVCASGAPTMQRSFLARLPVRVANPATIADGLAISSPYAEALADIVDTVDDILTVDDDDLIRSMQLVHTTTGLVLEPSGAAGIAAILAAKDRWSGLRVATILTGGNLTAVQVGKWLSSADRPR